MLANLIVEVFWFWWSFVYSCLAVYFGAYCIYLWLMDNLLHLFTLIVLVPQLLFLPSDFVPFVHRSALLAFWGYCLSLKLQQNHPVNEFYNKMFTSRHNKETVNKQPTNSASSEHSTLSTFPDLRKDLGNFGLKPHVQHAISLAGFPQMKTAQTKQESKQAQDIIPGV